MNQRKYLSPEDWLKKPRLVIGLMSGTSCDGIDASLVRFWIDNKKHKFEMIDFYFQSFNKKEKSLILNAINSRIYVKDLSNLNFLLAKWYSQAVKQILNKNHLGSEKVDLIGMHGQTVWHEPPQSTFQLGSASVLSALTKIPVVSDFRSSDVTLGGQGAPLVPIFDKEFLSDKNKNVIALNIGGIANITFLQKNKKVIAFDTGPGNILIDSITKKLFNKDYDVDGKLALRGNLSRELFHLLKRVKFVLEKPPKSTGRELYSQKYVEQLIEFIFNQGISRYDAIYTITRFTSWTIAENIRNYADAKSRIIVSGGGAKNKTILKLLKEELPNSEIIISDDLKINSDAKESICFAYLAWRNLANLTGNIKSVTGAQNEIILGSLTLP